MRAGHVGPLFSLEGIVAVSFGCKCPERDKPVAESRVMAATVDDHPLTFSGYHRTPSEYSTVHCRCCRAIGRTKAAYVDQLPDGTFDGILAE